MAIQTFNSANGFSVGSNVVVIDDNGNVAANSLSVSANANITGNITADYLIGNGSQLTDLPIAAIIANGTSNVSITAADGPVTIGVGGVTNNIAKFDENEVVFSNDTHTAFTFDLANKNLILTGAGDISAGYGPGGIDLFQGDITTSIGTSTWSMADNSSGNFPYTQVTPGFVSTEYNDGSGPVMPTAPSHLTVKQYVDDKSYVANGTSNVSIAAADSAITFAVNGINAGKISLASVAIGYLAGDDTQGSASVAIGAEAGTLFQGIDSVAIGSSAGNDSQGAFAIAIGSLSGQTLQGGFSVAVGVNAGFNAQGNTAVAIGSDAGSETQGESAVAIGQGAGQTNQGISGIAIGGFAGVTDQGENSIAIGPQAGNDTQGTLSVAVGVNAGSTAQGTTAVAIGNAAATTNQGLGAVAVGSGAGNDTQGVAAVAVGLNSGMTTQGSGTVAIGGGAGTNTQGNTAVAIGSDAGSDTQGEGAIAIGSYAGFVTQGLNSIAIGQNAGGSNQGINSVAIGQGAGSLDQPTNSIIINASGATLDGTESGLYINPVRNDTANTTNVVYYNTSTSEITYGPVAYGNTEVAAYLPTYTGNLGNVNIITASGNITALTFSGEAGNLSNISGANVTGTVANATFATGANLSAYANIVTDAAQPNITSLGTLSSLTTNGLTVEGLITANANAQFNGDVFFAGNVTLPGTINQISGNSGQFFGNATTGFGALYAGLSSGYTLLAQEVMQYASSFDGYSQLSFQNINGGSQATGDFIATADNGDDETNFIDLGIAGSGYDGAIAGANNALGTSLFPGDGYLYTQGNTSANTGGNLVLGSNQPDKVVKIIAGGSNTADVSLVIAASNTAATTTTTGTLTVAGGVGVTGNVVAGSIIATRVVPRVVTITTNVTPTPNGDTTDQYEVTALATAATFGEPTGTPYAGQKLTIRITDNGTGQTLAWNAIYRPIGVLLPPETVANKTIYVGCIYNATVTTWDVVAVSQES